MSAASKTDETDGEMTMLKVYRNPSVRGKVETMTLPGRELAERRRRSVIKGKSIPCPLCGGAKPSEEKEEKEYVCHLCKGDGVVSEWVRKYEIEKTEDDTAECLVCYEAADYGISTEVRLNG